MNQHFHSCTMRRKISCCVLASVALSCLDARLVETALSQQQYSLTAPGLGRNSTAEIGPSELVITDDGGRVTRYARRPQWDSADGNWQGYESAAAGQVLRWPTNGRGPMMIGRPVGGSIEFRASQMTVQPMGGPAVGPGLVLPPGGIANQPVAPIQSSNFFQQVWQQQPPQAQTQQLATRTDSGQVAFLGRGIPGRLQLYPQPTQDTADWLIVPSGPGLVRIQQRVGNSWLAVGIGPGRILSLEVISQNPGQLWRVLPCTLGFDGYWLESAIHPGWALLGSMSSGVTLSAINGSPSQVWLPVTVVQPPTYEPVWRSVSQQLQANAPLAPASVELLNTHRNAIVMLVTDRRTGRSQKVRVEANDAAQVQFDRDPGATLVESYELRSASGVWEQQQSVIQIPPAVWYDISVYEEFLQSIAIDRTGTSPNVIEDVNYQPKSVGWIPVPAGPSLPDRAQIDVFAEAKAAGNPGAVRRFDPKSLEKPRRDEDPLESLLKKATPSDNNPSVPAPPAPRRKF